MVVSELAITLTEDRYTLWLDHIINSYTWNISIFLSIRVKTKTVTLAITNTASESPIIISYANYANPYSVWRYMKSNLNIMT